MRHHRQSRSDRMGFRFSGILVMALLAGLCGWALPVRAESLSARACDLDHDGDVDLVDFGLLQACFSGAGVAQNAPTCQAARLDLDADVDRDDLHLFAASYTGPGVALPPGRLLITEIMAANQSTVRDPDQTPDQYPDWMEIYNEDSEARELGGLYLTNNLAAPTLWPIPVGVVIEGGQRLVFWADAEPGQGPRHTNFLLDAAGQTVALVAADGQTVIDQVTFPALAADVSFGRYPDIGQRWLTFRPANGPATPGASNGSLGVPVGLIIESDLPVVAGRNYTTQNRALLHGQCSAGAAQSILVNGLPAQWDALAGTWTIGTTPLLIARGSKWHYLDNTPNPAPAGWQTVSVNDPWPEQNARLGYGGDGETQPPLKYGPDANNKYMTYYFRRTFLVGDLANVTGLTLRLLRDDGAAVYINGNKVALPQSVDNMPDTFDNTTPASSTVDSTGEQTYYEATGLSKSLLVPNATNVIAVEVHQINKTSTDLSFDLELVAEGTGLSTGVPLVPGLNTLVVQAFDGPNGTGDELERGAIDVFYDDMTHNVISGTLAGNTTLTANLSPWHVTANVTVPAGVTLTIEPGVTVFFAASTGITVNGKLVAQGTEASHITLTRAPGVTGTWSGVAFTNTLQPNVLSYIDQDHGDGQGHSIGVSYSRLLLDHATWSGVNTTVLEVEHPSILVQNCMVPGAGSKELFHGVNISGAEYFIIQNTTFGVPTGYNDVVDFSGCKRPGPILQVYNCTFLGGRDDGLDLDGTDAHIEGNLFTHFYWGEGNPGTSNAVSTGLRFDLNSEVVVVRNVFINSDHALLLKEDCFARFEHNTVFDCNVAVVNFGEPERGYTPGRGAALDGNILYGYPAVFQNLALNPSLQLTVNRTLVAASEHHFGVGNIDADPMFVNPNAPYDLHLLPGSPAIGAGRNGLDMGAYVPGGVTIVGSPNGITDQTTATLSVWGPGVVKYRYRVRDDGNWGPWSADRAVDTPVELAGLQDGHSYAVEAIGQNSAAVWQAESEAASTPAWVVDTTP